MERSVDKSGYVYCLVNESLPGMVKVGMTRNKLEKRVKELFGTGVPTPFSCFCAKWMDDPYPVEQAILDAFDPIKLDAREFLRIDPLLIQCVLTLFPGQWYMKNGVYMVDTQQRQCLVDVKDIDTAAKGVARKGKRAAAKMDDKGEHALVGTAASPKVSTKKQRQTQRAKPAQNTDQSTVTKPQDAQVQQQVSISVNSTIQQIGEQSVAARVCDAASTTKPKRQRNNAQKRTQNKQPEATSTPATKQNKTNKKDQSSRQKKQSSK